jgi:hypothetical protein
VIAKKKEKQSTQSQMLNLVKRKLKENEPLIYMHTYKKKIEEKSRRSKDLLGDWERRDR